MVSTTFQGGWGIPGAGDAIETSEREIFWGGDWGKGQILTASASFSSTLADAGNSPTSDIRPGLLLGKITASGELAEWNYDLADGTQDLWGVNFLDLRMIDFNATAADRVAGVVLRAPLKASQLLIEGSALVGHAAEYVARRMLHGGGSILDDDPQGFLAGGAWRYATDATTSLTVAAANNRTVYTLSNTNSTTVQLPAAQVGLEWIFIRTGDEEFIINGTSDIVTDGSVTGDTITYSTASEHLGAYVHIRGILTDGTTVKWFANKADSEAMTNVVA